MNGFTDLTRRARNPDPIIGLEDSEFELCLKELRIELKGAFANHVGNQVEEGVLVSRIKVLLCDLGIAPVFVRRLREGNHGRKELIA